MEDFSAFMDKELIPTEEDVIDKLGSNYSEWAAICESVRSKYPNPKEEWNFPGKKYGWSFRMKDKKRAIIYLLPRLGYFMAAFVFGEKAMVHIRESGISQEIIDDLEKAKKYAEGRGVRIEIRDARKIHDIEKLIDIKLAN